MRKLAASFWRAGRGGDKRRRPSAALPAHGAAAGTAAACGFANPPRNRRGPEKAHFGPGLIAPGLTPAVALGAEGACPLSEVDSPGNPAISDPRIAAMLPDQLIQGGEVIVLLLKPSPWFIVLESLPLLAAVAVLLSVGWWLTGQGYSSVQKRDMLTAAAALAGLRMFWQFLEWMSRLYVLTDRRLISVKGVTGVSVVEFPLHQIKGLRLFANRREKFLGLGSLEFAIGRNGHHHPAATGSVAQVAPEAAPPVGAAPPVAGALGNAPVQPTVALHWRTIAQPLQVHETVQRALQRYR